MAVDRLKRLGNRDVSRADPQPQTFKEVLFFHRDWCNDNNPYGLRVGFKLEDSSLIINYYDESEDNEGYISLYLDYVTDAHQFPTHWKELI